MNSLLRQYNRYKPVDLSLYRKFVVAGTPVGWVSRSIAKLAQAEPALFTLDADTLHMQDRLKDNASRTEAMAEMLERWRDRGHVPGWRNELYRVGESFSRPPLFLIERAAAPLFGICCYGINVNGLTMRDGEDFLWIARRSQSKQVDPGMLDVMAGGGLAYGLSIAETMVKECGEEAGISPALAGKARPRSMTTLMIEAHEGLRVGQQFNFDLDLPADFQPHNNDGEVDGFVLWPIAKVLENLRTADDFMIDVALVAIDLMIAKGYVTPEDRDYLALVAGLRKPLPFAVT